MSTTTDSPTPALLFIPDISGFTRFITDTEISHSKHIIEELLEVMIEANTLDLQISEIEGDAILFYRFGEPPGATEMMEQVRRMFVNFHQHLRKYERYRICQCGACKTAHQLTLKMVAHYGEITQNKVKSFTKLFGKEVIVVHRLLKNSIEHHEYAMLTKPLTDAMTETNGLIKPWAPLQRGSEEYDSGKVAYEYLALAPLLNEVPDPVVQDYSIDGATTHAVHSTAVIEAPMDMVFGVLADLPWRAKWVVGLEAGVEHINHKIIQEGSEHRCISGGPILITHDYKHAEDVIAFTETNSKKTACTVYTLRKLSSDTTELEADYFMKDNFFKRLYFILFKKNKTKKYYRQTWQNLNNYCQLLLVEGKSHPLSVKT
ncbi:MAG: DUF2652 domain-containing protein [Saprospiraceae bacterium]|jgi:hypothetical protein|nr:DUF2652 domain-containing protein [Saprospiraceae bacterium]